MPLKLCTYTNFKTCEIALRFSFCFKFIILWLLAANFSYAQIRFNYNYDFNNNLNQSSNILCLNGSYLIIEQIDDYDSLNTGIGIRKLDSLGTELWVKKIYRKKALLYPGFSNSCQIVNGNTILISSGFIDTLNYEQRAQGSILAINTNGDSLWQKTYGGLWKDGFYSSALDDDNNIVSVGFYHTSSTSYDAWAVKTDTLGNVIWDKKFGGINGDVFSSVIQADDGGYYLAGASNSFNSYDDAFLVKINVDGNLLWQKTFSTPLADGINGIILSNNKLYLAGYQYTDYPLTNKFDGMLLITDLDGTLISSKVLGGATLSNSFRTKPIALADGSIIVAGESRTQINPNAPWGWLFKFNQDGDSIWARTYYNNPNAPNYIYDLKATADGGFIMAGTTVDSLGGVGAQNSWVLKVDEFGCELENCQIYDGLAVIQEEQNQLKIYPNPNNGNFSLEYSVSQSSGWLYVYDVNGKEVCKEYISPYTTIKNLQLNGQLAKGMYAISLVFGKERFLGKFVVE